MGEGRGERTIPYHLLNQKPHGHYKGRGGDSRCSLPFAGPETSRMRPGEGQRQQKFPTFCETQKPEGCDQEKAAADHRVLKLLHHFYFYRFVSSSPSYSFLYFAFLNVHLFFTLMIHHVNYTGLLTEFCYICRELNFYHMHW